MVQVILGIITLVVLGVATYVLFKKRANEVPESSDYGKKTLEYLLRVVKDEVADAIKDNDVLLASDVNYEAVYRNKRRLADADRNSYYGIPSAVKIVKAFIRDIIQRELPDRESCLDVINFDDVINLESQYKWELLLLRLKDVCGNKVIRYLEDNYRISELRFVDNGYSGKMIREVDYKFLDFIFASEVIAKTPEGEDVVTYSDMLDVLAQVVFSNYRGFKVIDSLMRLELDGLNFGSSGSIRYEIDGDYDIPYKTTNSVWVQVDAKWVLLSFIDFYSVNRMKTIINQLVSYGSSPPMTEKMPYKVTDGYDGSRRVAVRPPAGEAWFFSCRKFTLSIYTMEKLLNKIYVKNWELPAKLIYFLMRAEQTTPFTGPQNTGKTSLMKAAVECVEDKNIRVLEMSFELALREIYKDKNVLTVKPTDYVTSANLQDLLKKTDGWVSMVGEVAEDIVAARMIQFCLVGSAFTIFSHHGKDDWGLVNGLTNSLVASGEYHDHNVAMSTVLDAIKHNVHLDFTEERERVISYISEIIKISELEAYPDMGSLMKEAEGYLSAGDIDELTKVLASQTLLMKEFYTRSTDRVKFASRKIIVYNPATRSYEPNEWYTVERFKDIMMRLNSVDRAEFIKFYKDNWRRDE